jgi:glucose-6-phosphate 1-dehydrogenase
VRGQYRAGASAGGPVKGYLEELGKPDSTDRDLRRAQGRDRQLALGGRALLHPHRQAPADARFGDRHQFKPVPHSIFGDGAGNVVANQLVIRLQPDEGVKQYIMIKDPGPGGMRLRHATLDMSFADTFERRPRTPTSA